MKGTTGVPVRLQYTKLGKIRWIGHRDVARALERAFRVAQLPLAFSEGFSPRPRVSFGLALSTGHESVAEYVDLVLAEPVDLAGVAAQLTDALPDGLAVVGAAELVDRAPALQEAVTSVEWLVSVAAPDGSAVDAARLREQVAATLALSELPVQKKRKGRELIEDIRPVIRRVDVRDDTPVNVEMELATQPRSAKPGEVLAAVGGLSEVRARRTHQWIERDGARREPLDADTRPHVLEARAS
ncbi:MAG TPA: TIGR03936 family radical SAM-associated protein [Acidimicrobiia bacterium]|nr:TIGR03936 family radical SAM-associated protein [Acidimicrobiia bacterium]